VGCALAITVALGACGSSSSSSSASSSAGSSATTSTAAAASSATSTAAATSNSSGVSQSASELATYLQAPTKINISTPLNSAAPRGKSLVVLGTNNPQNVEIQQEFHQIAKQYGWSYSPIDYDPANTGAFQAALNTALQKHPDFINESGTPLTPSVEAQVKAAGVKLIPIGVYPLTIQAPVIADPDSYAADAEFARPVADYFISDSKGTGNALIVHVPSYPILDGFTDTFQKIVKQRCPGCKYKFLNLTLPQIANGTFTTAIISAVRADPDATYLVMDDGSWADSIPSGLAAAGLKGKIKVIGQAPNQAEMAAIRSGDEVLWTGFYAQETAMQAFDAMFRNLEGMPIPAEDGITPTQAITKANIGSSDNWAEPSNALQQYEALWNK
jgi:hypothetical protein